METKIEFKVKTGNLTWEETPVNRTKTFTELHEIVAYAKRLANLFQNEIRWNYQGLTQGHYVDLK